MADGAITAEDGEITTVAPVTLSVAVPLIPLSDAVMTVEPDATPVARPLEFIVAMPGVPDVHVAVEVTIPIEPSLYVAVALNCRVAPTEMFAVAGATAMDVTVLVTVPTLSVAVPLIPLSEAMIVVEPEAAAVASPLEFTVATDGVVEVQLAIELMSADVLSLYFPVAVNCSVAPSPTLALAGATETDVRVFVGGSPIVLDRSPEEHPRLESMSESEKDAAGTVNIQ